jgi:hypothetical protein
MFSLEVLHHMILAAKKCTFPLYFIFSTSSFAPEAPIYKYMESIKKITDPTDTIKLSPLTFQESIKLISEHPKMRSSTNSSGNTVNTNADLIEDIAKSCNGNPSKIYEMVDSVTIIMNENSSHAQIRKKASISSSTVKRIPVPSTRMSTISDSRTSHFDKGNSMGIDSVSSDTSVLSDGMEVTERLLSKMERGQADLLMVLSVFEDVKMSLEAMLRLYLETTKSGTIQSFEVVSSFIIICIHVSYNYHYYY